MDPIDLSAAAAEFARQRIEAKLEKERTGEPQYGGYPTLKEFWEANPHTFEDVGLKAISLKEFASIISNHQSGQLFDIPQSSTASDHPCHNVKFSTKPFKGTNVNHPDHYNAGGIECIDAMEAAATPEEFRGFCKLNALKYLWRERGKNGNEDLEKAVWYLNRAIESSKREKAV